MAARGRFRSAAVDGGASDAEQVCELKIETNLARRELVGDGSGVRRQPGRPVELGQYQRVTFAASGQSFMQTRMFPVVPVNLWSTRIRLAATSGATTDYYVVLYDGATHWAPAVFVTGDVAVPSGP